MGIGASPLLCAERGSRVQRILRSPGSAGVIPELQVWFISASLTFNLKPEITVFTDNTVHVSGTLG